MFRIFPFGFSATFNLNQLWGITSGLCGMAYSVLKDIDIDEISKQCTDTFSSMHETEQEQEENYNFIELNQDEDMYLLRIDLMGIDLRELSIRYDLGIIAINLNRLEIEKNNVGGFSNNIVVKKRYNKEFPNIEEIDTSRLMKTIEDGVLMIRMPKKYVINEHSKVVDVENYLEDKK